MKQDQILMLVVAFLVGLFFKQLMGSVCGGNLVEGGPGEQRSALDRATSWMKHRFN